MPSNHFILCHPLLLLSSIFPSIRVFSNESAVRIRWPEYWSFSFSISSSSESSRLISFRIDWSDLLAVQGTLKSLLQLHSLKASVLQCSAFFMVQLSHLYMTTEKIITLNRHLWFQIEFLVFPLLRVFLISVDGNSIVPLAQFKSSVSLLSLTLHNLSAAYPEFDHFLPNVLLQLLFCHHYFPPGPVLQTPPSPHPSSICFPQLHRLFLAWQLELNVRKKISVLCLKLF